MKRVVAAIATILVSGAVIAQTNENININDNDNDNNATATNVNAVEQDQVQIVDIETNPTENSNIGSSSSHSSSNNSLANVGNASVTVEGDDFPASTAHAPSINPTSPCMGSSAAGGQGMSFGVSVGSSWRDKECEKREAFRMGMQSGHPEITALAFEVYRSLEVVQDVLNDAQPAEQAKVSTHDNTLVGIERALP